MCDYAPRVHERHVKETGSEHDRSRLTEAVHHIDEVEQAVLKRGVRWTINVDEASAKIIHIPWTVWSEINDACSVIHSNRNKTSAFTMIFATSASGHKLKSFVYLGDSVHLMLAPRWVNNETWTRYIKETIAPDCERHTAVFICDSFGAHFDDSYTEAAETRSISLLRVPVNTTAELQPNNVRVYCPTSSLARRGPMDGAGTRGTER